MRSFIIFWAFKSRQKAFVDKYINVITVESLLWAVWSLNLVIVDVPPRVFSRSLFVGSARTNLQRVGQRNVNESPPVNLIRPLTRWMQICFCVCKTYEALISPHVHFNMSAAKYYEHVTLFLGGGLVIFHCLKAHRTCMTSMLVVCFIVYVHPAFMLLFNKRKYVNINIYVYSHKASHWLWGWCV